MEVAPVVVTPDAARKRKRDPIKWKCNVAKRLRLDQIIYVSVESQFLLLICDSFYCRLNNITLQILDVIKDKC